LTVIYELLNQASSKLLNTPQGFWSWSWQDGGEYGVCVRVGSWAMGQLLPDQELGAGLELGYSGGTTGMLLSIRIGYTLRESIHKIN
jgi:hypothetical protein